MFCEHCGKEIVEGERCDCAVETAVGMTNEPAQAPMVPEKDEKQMIVAAFSGVPGAIKGWYSNTQQRDMPIATGIVLGAGEMIAHMVAWLLLAEILTDAIGRHLSRINGTAALFGLLTGLSALTIGFLIPTAGQMLKRERVQWQGNFSTAVSVALLPAALFLLGALLGLVSFRVGVCLMVLAAMVGVVECSRQTREQLFAGEGIWAALLGAAIPALFAVTVGSVVVNVLLGYVEEIIKSLIFGTLW
jgi:hypothetical protein